MKTKFTNKLKIAAFSIAMLAAGTVSAQTTTGSIGRQTNGDIALGTANTTVKVIDNKGTKKYLQSSNGITTFTDTAPNGGVVTTWQLGGTLDVATTITTGTQTFTIDGEEFLLANTEAESGTATAATDHADTTGFTVLVRDQADGQIKKMLLTDLLKVEAIRVEYEQAADAAADVNIVVAGLPIIDTATSGKLFVYRNGVKLRWGTTTTKDFNADTVEQVTINYSAIDLPMYEDDIIEIQYIK